MLCATYIYLLYLAVQGKKGWKGNAADLISGPEALVDQRQWVSNTSKFGSKFDTVRDRSSTLPLSDMATLRRKKDRCSQEVAEERYSVCPSAICVR